ncbi:MAG: sulfotransferase [Granulosicoccus sp.]
MTPRVVGIGLNKTATKSLAQCMEAIGYWNKSYCLHAFTLYQQKNWPALFDIMDNYNSFEDWPWPLMYREIEQHYPDARFILTTRASPDIWYRSLCKMAVRMGPLSQFEKHIYGYSMPQGRREEHLQFYNRHNAEVREYFADKPGKLLEVCFDEGVQMSTLCTFLDAPENDFQVPHENRSEPVYGGDSLWRAYIAQLVYQSRWYTRVYVRKVRNRLNRLRG